MVRNWEDFWGCDAEYDIAQDLEEHYEKTTHKSAVLWTDFDDVKDGQKVPTDDLKNRPEVYSTHGYTCDFESWGIDKCKEATKAGCVSVNDVYKFITGKDF